MKTMGKKLVSMILIMVLLIFAMPVNIARATERQVSLPTGLKSEFAEPEKLLPGEVEQKDLEYNYHWQK